MLEHGLARGRHQTRASIFLACFFRALCSFLSLVCVFNQAQAVLVLCRGLFTPGHNKEPSRVHDNVHGCALRVEHGGYPLEEAFAEV